MQTECNTKRFDFQPLARRDIRGSFDGGAITSDAGALLLREVEAKMAIKSTLNRLELSPPGANQKSR